MYESERCPTLLCRLKGARGVCDYQTGWNLLPRLKKLLVCSCVLGLTISMLKRGEFVVSTQLTAILISTGPIKKIIHSSGVHTSIADCRPTVLSTGIMITGSPKDHFPALIPVYKLRFLIWRLVENHKCYGIIQIVWSEAEFEILAPHLSVNSPIDMSIAVKL